MYKNSRVQLHSFWCLIALLILVHTFSQASTVHLHLHHSHDHHNDLHSHAHGRYSVDGEIHQKHGVELETSQLLLLSKVQLDSLLFIVGSVLIFLCLTKQRRVLVSRRETEPVVSCYSIPPPPRAPPQGTV